MVIKLKKFGRAVTLPAQSKPAEKKVTAVMEEIIKRQREKIGLTFQKGLTDEPGRREAD